MTYVDIGANIGQHSMYVASLVGEKGSVYSFEPIPFIYNQLQDSLKANHFEHIIHAKNIALGEHESSETLHISRKNVGGSSLVSHENESETIIVEVKNGDRELANIPSINVIKIDVEGYEYEVLTGIKETLLKHSPTIFLEFSGEIYNKQNKNHGAKILALLRECRYTLYDIEDDMKEIHNDKEYLALFPHTLTQTNLLCIVR
jgi:FkbM family methyltransferase